jgi:hypothetical protein
MIQYVHILHIEVVVSKSIYEHIYFITKGLQKDDELMYEWLLY